MVPKLTGFRGMAHPSHLQQIDEKELQDVVWVNTSVGACMRGNFKRTGRKVAVKLLTDSKWIDRLRKVLILEQVCSEQVLVPLGVYKTHSLVGLVWDWMTEGSLYSALHETDLFPELSMALCLQILLDVAVGLAHLHAIPLLHGALKATNVLLDQHYRAKLCDWGQHLTMTTLNGNGPCYRDLAYMSPEVILGAIPSVEADIYSFGVLLWEVLNRKRPCEGIDQLQTQILFTQDKLEHGVAVDLLPPMTPQNHALTQLMITCLNCEPNKRPSAEDCAVVLRMALAAFDPQTFSEAVLHVKACKERKLLSYKLPIELELNSGLNGPKNWTSKVIPKGENQTMSPSEIPKMHAKGKVSLLTATRGCYQVACFRDTGPKDSVQSGSTGSDHVPCQMSAGMSCCRLLQERRETIVRCMTEGRLNNLLDMLRARRAVTRETYEIITAALTLTARTRCLLDICACLGENVAILVATTLGLVSTKNTQIAQKWQAG